ncbi:LIN28B [Cordylochernes scorpioides]|uniref:LIN28B n=1 Tax=Cordylochernes scorpioides TaxID=51811 RepID=A0ABY6LI95_9ARAC|nr:LIN28B [Cordylochernes scorpioides]
MASTSPDSTYSINIPCVVWRQSVIQMAGFRSLGDEEDVEFECKVSDKGLEATAVSGPEGQDCKGSHRRPMSKKRFRKISSYFVEKYWERLAHQWETLPANSPVYSTTGFTIDEPGSPNILKIEVRTVRGKHIEPAMLSSSQLRDINVANSRTACCRCYNCGEFANHIAAKCSLGPQPKRCHQCKAVDHLIAECPMRSDKKNNNNNGAKNGDVTPQEERSHRPAASVETESPSSEPEDPSPEQV